VLELFAGVGGFHHGLEQANHQRETLGLPRAFDVVWASQWEPGSKKQHAARVYAARWGLTPVNRDLAEVLDDADEMAHIDALAPTMVVGGFPCQDYSVARSAPQSQGLQGKKGVLWWSIHRLLKIRIAAGQPIQQLMLENVDRLINSPSTCRGRDFAIILASLQSLGYAASWKIVNSGEYGYAQRRKRVFIVAVHQGTPEYQRLQAAASDPLTLLTSANPFARAFPGDMTGPVTGFELGHDIYEAQESYQPGAGGKSRFANTGVCIGGQVFTGKVCALKLPDYTAFTGHALPLTLGDVVAQTHDVPASFYIDSTAMAPWEYAKGAKSIPRISATGFAYNFSEGAMSFPDSLDRPSRTIITSEGGASASRTKHVVRAADGRLRRLTPEELEELNGFPRGFTSLEGVNDIARARLMGNALITGVVACIAAAMVEGAPSNPVGKTAAGSIASRADFGNGLPRSGIVHNFAETLHLTDAVSTGDWTYSLYLYADLTCALYFDVKLVGHFMPTVAYRFTSLANLRDDVGTRLATTRIPPPLLSAVLGAIPKFIADAEVAYQTGQYYSRPS
jgi:DNA (cytosine-5)-methyltransferase 1